MGEIKNEDIKIIKYEDETKNQKTNLSNKKKYAANLIYVIITAVIALIMIGVYPKIHEIGSKNSISPYINYGFLKDLSKNTFVLYKDALEAKDGKSIEASDIFLKPEGEFTNSNEYNVLKDKINNELKNWKIDLESDFENLDYVVMDENQKIIKSNNHNDLSELVKTNDINSLNKKYSFYLTINFNENGIMNISNVYGSDEYEIRNELAEYKLRNIVYTNNYDIEKPIKNMTFIYGVSKDLKYFDRISSEIQNSEKESYRNITYIYVLILAGLMSIFSLFTPLKVEREIWICKKFIKIPFEIILILMCIVIGCMFAASGEVIFYTLNGDFVNKVLVSIGFGTNIGEIIVYLCNLLYWTVFISCIFISVVTIKNIFSVGLVKYFKEKTLTGIILRLIKRMIHKTCENLENVIRNVDLNDKSNKLIFKIVAIDAGVILIFFILWVIGTFLTMSFIFSAFWGILLASVYCVIMFNLLKKYLIKINNMYSMLFDATNEIARGNLDVTINEDLGLFNPFKEQIEKIQKGFKRAVDEEVKSQRMKTELISNVSHDLKTPLTSIITYVDLLKRDNITEEERKSYIDTLDKKSQRLKFLIEDLFEVSKASSGNINLNLVKVDIVELMKQTQIELEDKINSAALNIKNNFPSNKVVLDLDSQKTFRILENLLTNVVKYAMKGSRVYIDITEDIEKAEITIKNMSAEEITFNAFDIVERFQRGDKSRNTEGSGLGLAIVKSFVEVQGGTFKVEIDGDLFKVEITFRK